MASFMDTMLYLLENDLQRIRKIVFFRKKGVRILQHFFPKIGQIFSAHNCLSSNALRTTASVVCIVDR